MKRWYGSLLALLAIGVLGALAHAQTATIKPAIVYANGGKFDKSFNEGVSNGAKKFTDETKIAVVDFEPANETQFEQAQRRFAQRGQDPIIAVGFSQAVALEKVAKEFPNIHFTIIDMMVDLPNVQSVLFKEQEGSFLVGMLAALASKSGKIGFVGGMDIPLIRRFQCGYEQGVKYANPNAEVISNMTGTTPAAWNDPGRGAELAKGQFDRGVDVVYAAAGNTGTGVLQAAKDRGKYRDRRRFQPELPASRHDADLDDEARRSRGLSELQGGARPARGRAACRCWASRKAASTGRSTSTTRSWSRRR